MKSDLDPLMHDAGLDEFLVTGPAAHNPNKAYFTGLVHVTSGYLLKKAGEPPVLFHRSMERDEAARTGLETKSIEDYGPTDLIEKSNGDHVQAEVLLLKKILDDYEVSGRMGLYGKMELGPGFGIFDRLRQVLDGIELIG